MGVWFFESIPKSRHWSCWDSSPILFSSTDVFQLNIGGFPYYLWVPAGQLWLPESLVAGHNFYILVRPTCEVNALALPIPARSMMDCSLKTGRLWFSSVLNQALPTRSSSPRSWNLCFQYENHLYCMGENVKASNVGTIRWSKLLSVPKNESLRSSKTIYFVALQHLYWSVTSLTKECVDTDTAGPSTIIVQSCQVQAAVGLVERDVGIRYMMYTCRFSCIYIYIISHKMRVFLRYGECTHTHMHRRMGERWGTCCSVCGAFVVCVCVPLPWGVTFWMKNCISLLGTPLENISDV